MRLLNTETYSLVEHSAGKIPSFAILSHRWGNDEVSYKDYVKGRVTGGIGFKKIRDFCDFAKAQREQHQWVWMDSCCIDKRSSSELTEAINSMYQWYQNAKTCYAYLSDVTFTDKTKMERFRDFERSVWFTRGWTLQELLAPSTVTFCDKDWEIIGSRTTLARQIENASGVPACFLEGELKPQEASIAMRMSWLSRRTTTIPEDIAYCVLGLFNVNMPLLYGEGKKAFMRLQQEIIKSSDDESIFAWTFDIPEWGMLAPSPGAFSESGNVVNIHLCPEERMPFSLTNKGLEIRSSSQTNAQDNVDSSTLLPMGYPTHRVALGCFSSGKRKGMTDQDHDAGEMWENSAITIELCRDGPLWSRVNCKKLGRTCFSNDMRRENGTYEGRGVQRVYIVRQPTPET